MPGPSLSGSVACEQGKVREELLECLYCVGVKAIDEQEREQRRKAAVEREAFRKEQISQQMKMEEGQRARFQEKARVRMDHRYHRPPLLG